MLRFADDNALFTTNSKGLQTQLDCKDNYSGKWGPTINVSTTHIPIFETRKANNNCR